MQGNVLGQSGGGSKINGIIQEYQVQAGNNVSAGDFVQYVTNTNITAGTNTQLSANRHSGEIISAVALNENKVFIAYGETNGYSLYGVIVTINGTTVTAGSDTQLNAQNYSGYGISAIALNENKVFIAHTMSSGYNNYYKYYGMIVTISENTITVNKDAQLTSDTNYRGGPRLSALLLSNSKIFIIINEGSYLSGILVTISGNNIVKGTATQLESGYMGGVFSPVLLNENKVFIAGGPSSGSSFLLYGMIVTINGTTITAGTITTLSTDNYSGKVISAVTLNENKVFIAHSYSSSYYLYGMIVTITGDTIIIDNDAQLSNNANSGKQVSTLALNENSVFTSYGTDSSPYNLYGIIVGINGNSITAGTNTQLSTYANYALSAVLLKPNKVFIGYDFDANNYYLYGMLIDKAMDSIQKVTSGGTIKGILKSIDTTNNTVKIYEPDYTS